jgi:hypothetical protein
MRTNFRERPLLARLTKSGQYGETGPSRNTEDPSLLIPGAPARSPSGLPTRRGHRRLAVGQRQGESPCGGPFVRRVQPAGDPPFTQLPSDGSVTRCGLGTRPGVPVPVLPSARRSTLGSASRMRPSHVPGSTTRHPLPLVSRAHHPPRVPTHDRSLAGPREPRALDCRLSS